VRLNHVKIAFPLYDDEYTTFLAHYTLGSDYLLEHPDHSEARAWRFNETHLDKVLLLGENANDNASLEVVEDTMHAKDPHFLTARGAGELAKRQQEAIANLTEPVLDAQNEL